MTRIGWMVLLVSALGCARHVAPGPERLPPAAIYDLRLTVGTETTLSPALQAEVLPDAAALLQPAQLELSLVLGVMDARRFRDDSLGQLLWIDAATANGAPWDLAGRSAELRAFLDGEILAVDGWSHLAGPGRGGESLEILLGLLSPHIPSLDDGESGRSVSTFAVEVDPWRGLREQIAATWTHQGMDEQGWRFGYAGEWSGRGRGGPREATGALRFQGQVSGSVRVAQADHALLEHSADWTREVVLSFDDAPGGPVELVQTQRFHAELRRRPGPDPGIEARMRLGPEQRLALASASMVDPVAADARSLGRYLRPDTLAPTLAPAAPAALACLAAAGAPSQPLRLEIDAQGRARVGDGAGAPELAACVDGALASLTLPAHDDAPAIALWTPADGAAAPSTVELSPREVPLAFVLTPAGAETAARALADRLRTAETETGKPVQGSDQAGDPADGTLPAVPPAP